LPKAPAAEGRSKLLSTIRQAAQKRPALRALDSLDRGEDGRTGFHPDRFNGVSGVVAAVGDKVTG
jgi:hypothetical protein